MLVQLMYHVPLITEDNIEQKFVNGILPCRFRVDLTVCLISAISAQKIRLVQIYVFINLL